MSNNPHIKKLSTGPESEQSKSCYFTFFNCDDHTCSSGNSDGCNSLITCSTINTGGSEHDGICHNNNYGGCATAIACSPSRNTGKGKNNTIENEDDIKAFIRAAAESSKRNKTD